MEFLVPELTEYAEAHTTEETPVLKELNRETNAKILQPRMLSGHLQGRILSMISHMIKPKQILEIGTYTGYSAICLAEGLHEDGTLHTVEVNEELAEMIQSYFAKADLSDKIRLYVGDASDIIPQINETFDLVFIDADKEGYSKYYDLAFKMLRKGGFILADNVLWSGNVLQDRALMDADTKAIIDFNEMVQNDDRVENVLLPVRDGIMLVRKVRD
jgi:predicted O-methyltransferase YrrM